MELDVKYQSVHLRVKILGIALLQMSARVIMVGQAFIVRLVSLKDNI
jgi:hypothetical protein